MPQRPHLLSQGHTGGNQGIVGIERSQCTSTSASGGVERPDGGAYVPRVAIVTAVSVGDHWSRALSTATHADIEVLTHRPIDPLTHALIEVLTVLLVLDLLPSPLIEF